MDDVVHYLISTCVGQYVCSCGSFNVSDQATTNKVKVTCPDCIEKLGVKTEVDEEKVSFALAIVEIANQTVHDFGYYGVTRDCEFCGEVCEKSESIKHGENCVSLKAEAYLKSVKGK